MVRRRRSAGEWRRIIRDQRRSELSVAEFCRRARVQPVSFYAWRQRLRDDRGFVEVKIAGDATRGVPSTACLLELRLPGERSVLIPPGFDPQTLRALLAVLEQNADMSAETEAPA